MNLNPNLNLRPFPSLRLQHLELRGFLFHINQLVIERTPVACVRWLGLRPWMICTLEAVCDRWVCVPVNRPPPLGLNKAGLIWLSWDHVYLKEVYNIYIYIIIFSKGCLSGKTYRSQVFGSSLGRTKVQQLALCWDLASYAQSFSGDLKERRYLHPVKWLWPFSGSVARGERCELFGHEGAGIKVLVSRRKIISWSPKKIKGR